MIRTTLLAGFVLVALGGCGEKKAPPAQTEVASVTFANPGNAEDGGAAGDSAQTVAIQVPGFSAKLNVPGLDLGAGSNGLDGIPLKPNTRVTGMKIIGPAGDGSGGEGHGNVEMGFTDPTPPDQVIAYYRGAARGGGWTEVPPAAGQQFAATKAGDRGTEHLAIQVGAAGTGTRGRFLVTGG